MYTCYVRQAAHGQIQKYIYEQYPRKVKIMNNYNICDIDGLYVAHNEQTNDTILIGVSRFSNEITAEEIAEAYRIDMELDGYFKVRPLPKDLNVLKEIKFTWGCLITEEDYR